MNKNMKHLFFFTTLLVLLVGLTVVSATDVSDNSTVTTETVQTQSTSSMDNVDVVQTDHKKVQTTKSSVDKKTVKNDKKSLSKDSDEIDYYVSNNGKDTYDGSKDKPYKTINKALSQTKANNIYNIHITSGIYTGKGNTNLTINGNYNINLIGDGINKTVLDGEVKYVVKDASVWGYDPYFNYYHVSYGNRAMTINKGTGHISLSNMNIQHMLADGGSSITSNPWGGITNFGNLSVDNVYFYQNLGGVGASIHNKDGATLTVNNTIFQENRKASTTGCFGSGIYNNATALVTNSQFIGNIGRWGVLTNDKKLDVINCSFVDGKAYSAGSTFKFGSGIAANTGSADFFYPYKLKGVITHVINCTFDGNQQTDIYSDSADLLVTGCTFTNGTGIYLTGNDDNVKVTIANSTFKDIQPSNIFGSLSVKTGTAFAIYSIGKYNTTIENNVVDIDVNGYGMYINENTYIHNNSLNKYIFISGDNNIITNNTINTIDSYSIELFGKNNVVQDNTLYSHVFTGDKSILFTGSLRRDNNTVKNNIPLTGQTINLTNDNYNKYFDNNGVIRTNIVENGSTIIVTEDILNKNLTFSNIKIALQGKASIINGSINIINNSATIINSTTIKNNNKNVYAILIDTPGNRLINNHIIVNTTIPSKAIIIQKNNNRLDNNTINITTTTNNTAITIMSSDNDLRNIHINTTSTSNNEQTESIGILLNNTKNNYIQPSEINTNTTAIATGYKLINSNNNNIAGKVLSFNSDKAVAIELINSGKNNINVDSSIHRAKNGFTVISRGSKTKNNNNLFVGNTYIEANTAIGILVINATNTTITSNDEMSDIRTVSNNARGILTNNTEDTEISFINLGLLNSSNVNADIIGIEQLNSKNTNMRAIWMGDGNMRSIRGHYTSSRTLKNEKNSFLKLVNTTNTTVGKEVNKEGIRDDTDIYIVSDKEAIILENSDNNTIENTIIYAKTDYTIILNNSENNTITNNILNGNNTYGGDISVQEINSDKNMIENNTHNIIISITDDNYNHYFTNQTFIPKGVLVIGIGSDIYNKNLTFPTTITINNLGNYTLYNSTITLLNNTERASINNLKFKANDERETVLNITTSSSLDIINTTIEQTNNKKVAHSIYVNLKSNPGSNLTEHRSSQIHMDYTNIRLQAPEINSDNLEDISSAVYGKASLWNSNIIVTTTKTVTNGKIIALSNAVILTTNITVHAKNTGIGIYTIEDVSDALLGGYNTILRSNINITSHNNSIGAYSSNKEFSIEYSNIELHSKNNTPLYIQRGSITILENIINSYGNSQIIMKNMKGGLLTNTGLSDGLVFKNNNITIENQENTILLEIINSTEAYIYGNNITLNSIASNKTINNIPLIQIKNSNDLKIYHNYLKGIKLVGDYAITQINTTNCTILFNTPPIILTNDNYNQYFTNKTLNKNVTIIDLGSDIYHKDMIFNSSIIIQNSNNYTIYNTTITLTKNSIPGIKVALADKEVTSQIFRLNIINTDNRTSTMIIHADETRITNCNIYQENNNTKIIVVDNIVDYKFIQNTITTKGDNITILDINKLKPSPNPQYSLSTISSNSITATGEDITAIKINNTEVTKLTLQRNNIKIKSENPITAIQIDNTKTINMRQNTIIIKTNNKQTPIINMTNTTGQASNNYIESYDTTGNNAIKTTGGKITRKNNNPTNGKNYEENIEITIPNDITINNTYPVTINMTNMMDEPLNGTITIKIDNNSTTQTLINGITTINFTTQTPGSHTITITYPANDKYKQTTETITINVRKYTTTTSIEPINTTIYENTNIVAKITDENGNKVNGGQVIFLVNRTPLKDENGNIIYVDVTNGSATLKVDIPLEWININNTSVQYTGNNVYGSSNTTGLIKVNRLDANMKVEILNNKIRPGENAIIMVTVTDKNGNMIKSGKVIFKLNGKSIKDENGNTITIRIHNGIAIFKYRIPNNYSAKNYTLTAVSVGNTYNKIQTNTTLTLTRINTYIQTENIQFIGNTLHVQANIISATTQENIAYRETKVTIKINNKTFTKGAKITNGTINLNIDTSSIGRGNYKITIKTGDNRIYTGTQLDTYTYKAPVKSALNQTSSNGTLVKA